MTKFRVVIDPGHGGEPYPNEGGSAKRRILGAVHGGVIERDVNLVLALAIAKHLDSDIDVLWTRTSNDERAPLHARIELINEWHRAEKIHLLVSVHHNAAHPDYQGQWRGFKVFYHENSERGATAASLIAWDVRKSDDLRWTRSRCYPGADLGRRIAILQDTIPVAVLIEAGYLDNEDDRELIVDPDHRDSTAREIARSIKTYLTYKRLDDEECPF